MTREQKINKFLEFFKEKNSIRASCEYVSIAYKSAVVYINVLNNHGLLHKTVKNNHYGRPTFIFETTSKQLTSDMLESIDKQIRYQFFVNKEKFEKNYLSKKALKKQDTTDDPETIKQEASGIYLLSTKPSKHFIDKLKDQSKLAREERKSPKNYAGTSAGMVW